MKKKKEPGARPLRDASRPDYIADQFVIAVLERLDVLERQTGEARPDSASEKDADATEALRTVADLVFHLVGWAINHKIGLALHGAGNISYVGKARRPPEYNVARASADSHRHEIAGQSDELGFDARRRALINIIQAANRARDKRLLQPLVEALEALEFGEVTELVSPKRDGKKRGLRQRKLQLWALCFIEYRHALGDKKHELQERVGDTFAVSPDAIRGWEIQLPKVLDPFFVANALYWSKACGKLDCGKAIPDYECTWGKKKMLAHAKQFKALSTRQRPKK